MRAESHPPDDRLPFRNSLVDALSKVLMRLTLLIPALLVVGCGPRRFELDFGRTQVVVEEPLIRVSLNPGIEVRPAFPPGGDRSAGALGKDFNRRPPEPRYPWVLDFEAALTAPERGRLVRGDRLVRAARIDGLGTLELDLGHRVLEVDLGARRVVGTTIVGFDAPAPPVAGLVAPTPLTTSETEAPHNKKDVAGDERIFLSTTDGKAKRLTVQDDGGGWR